MAEWIGHLIANWPVWIVIPIAVIVGICLVFYSDVLNVFFPDKKEWWQDKAKRLEKQAGKKQVKIKKG